MSNWIRKNQTLSMILVLTVLILADAMVEAIAVAIETVSRIAL